MDRILEPELMEDREQAEAYDRADFSDSHGHRVALFRERYPKTDLDGVVLDIGCGSGDVLIRFASAFPQASFIGVDGSRPMLDLANTRAHATAGVAERIALIEAVLPSATIPAQDYSLIMSHSLLHHLHQPRVLWNTIKQLAGPDTWIFVADLVRPSTTEAARQVVDDLSPHEPDVLRRDFFNSLCAAFSLAEVRAQLATAQLDDLRVEQVSDIHLLIFGGWSGRPS
jgi:SAM-dependent methyltransferase